MRRVIELEPHWEELQVQELAPNGLACISFLIPSEHPAITQPLAIRCYAEGADEATLSWADGHHNHHFFHRYPSIERVAEVIVKQAREWMNSEIVFCSLRREGRLACQWVERPNGDSLLPPEFAAKLLLPGQPGPGEEIRKFCWSGEHDQVLSG